ncbi:C-C chemokine receptor type 8-like [Labeo rohita]|uniref:C-C chemokine receptor type 8-like n=1 Tax=Labeo rohita TaxID=84645 RepID=UPI0021E1F4AF|nr:C-C chemokine receptor type 8-like [Labeo rohita]
MSNSTVNFTTPEASTNSTTHSFEAINSLEMFAFGINVLLGLPIHSYITWLIITGTGNGVASEFLNLNLSVCEIGNSLNTVFGILTYFFPSCTIVTYVLQGLATTGRPLFQCLICVERYLAVVYPVTFLKYKPLRYRVICCSVVWIITLGSCLFCSVCILIPLSLLAYVWFISVQFLLFLFTQLFCLVAVLRALKQSGPGERKREEENHMKRRAFYLILITTVTMIIQYAPFTITGFFAILTQQSFLDFWCPAFLCYVLAGFVQPVLYLQRARKLSCLSSS